MSEAPAIPETSVDEALADGAIEQAREIHRARMAIWKDRISSGLLPSHIRTPQQADLIASKGAELGWKPNQAFSSMHVINGKVEMSAEAMLGLIYTHHPTATIRKVEHTDKVCRLAVKRHPDDVEEEIEFTWDMAKRAGLTGKKVWQQYPEAMLRARCVSQIRRWKFPDTAAGVYVEGEIGGPQPATVVQIPDEELSEVVSNAPALEGEIEDGEA